MKLMDCWCGACRAPFEGDAHAPNWERCPRCGGAGRRLYRGAHVSRAGLDGRPRSGMETRSPRDIHIKTCLRPDLDVRAAERSMEERGRRAPRGAGRNPGAAAAALALAAAWVLLAGARAWAGDPCASDGLLSVQQYLNCAYTGSAFSTERSEQEAFRSVYDPAARAFRVTFPAGAAPSLNDACATGCEVYPGATGSVLLFVPLESADADGSAAFVASATATKVFRPFVFDYPPGGGVEMSMDFQRASFTVDLEVNGADLTVSDGAARWNADAAGASDTVGVDPRGGASGFSGEIYLQDWDNDLNTVVILGGAGYGGGDDPQILLADNLSSGPPAIALNGTRNYAAAFRDDGTVAAVFSGEDAPSIGLESGVQVFDETELERARIDAETGAMSLWDSAGDLWVDFNPDSGQLVLGAAPGTVTVDNLGGLVVSDILQTNALGVTGDAHMEGPITDIGSSSADTLTITAMTRSMPCRRRRSPATRRRSFSSTPTARRTFFISATERPGRPCERREAMKKVLTRIGVLSLAVLLAAASLVCQKPRAATLGVSEKTAAAKAYIEPYRSVVRCADYPTRRVEVRTYDGAVERTSLKAVLDCADSPRYTFVVKAMGAE